MNKAMEWIDEVRGTDSLREVARRTGLNQATLNRQVNLDQLTYESVRDIARAYGRPVLADLIALGHLTESDAGIEGVERALHSATDAQLVLEVSRRLDVAPSMLWDAPISEAVERADAVVHRPDFTREQAEDDHLAAASPITEEDPDSLYDGA